MDYTRNYRSTDRFWFIWGMTSIQWSSSVSNLNKATVYWAVSPHYMAYEPNPWSINSLQYKFVKIILQLFIFSLIRNSFLILINELNW